MTVYGGDGVDLIIGGMGDDLIDGGDGAMDEDFGQSLDGGAGNDVIIDRDGSGTSFGRIKFAHVDPGTGLDNTDFHVI